MIWTIMENEILYSFNTLIAKTETEISFYVSKTIAKQTQAVSVVAMFSNNNKKNIKKNLTNSFHTIKNIKSKPNTYLN